VTDKAREHESEKYSKARRDTKRQSYVTDMVVRVLNHDRRGSPTPDTFRISTNTSRFMVSNALMKSVLITSTCERFWIFIHEVTKN